MGVVRKLAAAVTAQKEPETGRPKSWWRWPLLILLLLIGVTVAAWISDRNRRELAKLRHEKFKRQTETEQARVDAAKADSLVERDQHLNAVKESEARVADINRGIEEARRRHEVDKETISRLRWRDLSTGDDGTR